MAMVVLRLMIDGTDCLVNAIADPERTATPSIAQKIFMMVNACCKGRLCPSQRESDWAGGRVR
jgi:hypothetical protein